MAQPSWSDQAGKEKAGLDAFKLFAGHYASSGEGQKHFQDIIKVLKGSGPLCANIGVAIDAFLQGKTVQIGGPPA